MSDWNKRKVVELKAELKRRGLSQGGLKAELIARLVDDEEGTPNQTVAESVDADSADPADPTTSHPSDPADPAPGPGLEPAISLDVATLPAPTDIVSHPAPAFAPITATASPESTDKLAPGSAPTHAPDAEIGADMSSSASADSSLPSAPPPAVPHLSGMNGARGTETVLTSVKVSATDEMADTHKRKRNGTAHIDPSLEAAARKRHKPSRSAVSPSSDNPSDLGPDDFNPDPNLATDPAGHDRPQQKQLQPSSVASGLDSEAADDPDTAMPSAPLVEDSDQTTDASSAQAGLSRLPADQHDHPAKEISFEDQEGRERGSGGPPELLAAHPNDEDEFGVEPPVHPMTSALYIRNFMRPLRPQDVRDHVAALAQPPQSSSPANESAIVHFFVDQIRTHAYVVFTTTAAAVRVRRALHKAVWPDERERKPLWVDYAPPDQVLTWIETEQSGSSQASSRWEIVYSHDSDGIVSARLNASGGSGSVAAHPSFTRRTGGEERDRSEVAPRQMNRNVPTGPRALRDPDIVPTGPRFPGQGLSSIHNNNHYTSNNNSIGDNKSSNRNNSNNVDNNLGSSVINNETKQPTLQSLLSGPGQWTSSRPPVSFQPVSKELVARRLATMHTFYSQDPISSEDKTIHRYSFEDGDSFIYREPENFAGIRPKRRDFRHVSRGNYHQGHQNQNRNNYNLNHKQAITPSTQSFGTRGYGHDSEDRNPRKRMHRNDQDHYRYDDQPQDRDTPRGYRYRHSGHYDDGPSRPEASQHGSNWYNDRLSGRNGGAGAGPDGDSFRGSSPTRPPPPPPPYPRRDDQAPSSEPSYHRHRGNNLHDGDRHNPEPDFGERHGGSSRGMMAPHSRDDGFHGRYPAPPSGPRHPYRFYRPEQGFGQGRRAFADVGRLRFDDR